MALENRSPEYSPSRLITYSVFKVMGQVNITFDIPHEKCLLE